MDAAAALLLEGGGGEASGGGGEGAGSEGGGGGGARINDADTESDDDDEGDGAEAEEEGEGEAGDEEMEADLAGGVAGGDALNEYDIDVRLEGEALDEYLAGVFHSSTLPAHLQSFCWHTSRGCRASMTKTAQVDMEG